MLNLAVFHYRPRQRDYDHLVRSKGFYPGILTVSAARAFRNQREAQAWLEENLQPDRPGMAVAFKRWVATCWVIAARSSAPPQRS